MQQTCVESAWLRVVLPSALVMLLEDGYLLLFLLSLLAVPFLLSRVSLCLLQQKVVLVHRRTEAQICWLSPVSVEVLCWGGEVPSTTFWVSIARFRLILLCISLKLKKKILLLFLILSRNGNIFFKRYSVTLYIKTNQWFLRFSFYGT